MLLSTADIGLSSNLRTKLADMGIVASTFDDLVLLIVGEATKPQTSTEVTANTLPANARTFGLGGGGTLASKLTEKTFNYSTDGSSLTYDISNIREALPSDIAYLSTNVNLLSAGKSKSSARQSAGSVTMPDGVDQAKVQINLQTNLGSLVLTKTFPVGKNQMGSVALATDDLTAAPSGLSVTSNLEMLNEAVSRLQSKV